MTTRRIALGPRTQAGLVLALVAALGALLGILGDRLVAQQRAEPTMVDMGPMQRPDIMRPPGPRYGDRLAERLGLTPAQRSAIDSILDEEQERVRTLTSQFQPQFRTIANQTRLRVEEVLTPEQRAVMRTMRAERMRRLGDERPQFRDAVRPGPDERRRMPGRQTPDSAPL
jgi:Spy/CpxP family protein refolding chaperone